MQRLTEYSILRLREIMEWILDFLESFLDIF